MYCVRCGRETEENHTFCESCLQEMERFPVDPDTVVSLPHRQPAARKLPRRKEPTPEEQVVTLSRRIRRMTVALLVTAVMCVLLSLLLYHSLTSPTYGKGQNYKSIPVTSEPAVVETQETTAEGG